MAGLENFRLAVFRAVAEQRSFRKAAENLYLTQPAVSLQIKALEEHLGTQLFDRTGSGVTLTKAGDILHAFAQKSNALLIEAEQAIHQQMDAPAGLLELGASTTIAQYVLPGLLAEFRRAFPRVVFSLVSGNTEEIVKAVIDRRVALGFIEGPAQSRLVKSHAFLRDEIVFIVPRAHEWAERASIPCAEVVSVPLLVRERGSGTRRVIELALAKHLRKGAKPRIAMELDSTEAIKSAVEAGLGAGFVSRSAIAKDQRIGNYLKVLPIDGLRIWRDFLFVYASGPGPQGLAGDLHRFLTSHLSTLRSPES